jgi:hypothetical protein
VFKRKYRDATGKWVRSPHFTVEFQHLGEHVRENSGMTSKAEAKAFEQKRRQEITDRVKQGKAPSITLSEAAMRYFIPSCGRSSTKRGTSGMLTLRPGRSASWTLAPVGFAIWTRPMRRSCSLPYRLTFETSLRS